MGKNKGMFLVNEVLTTIWRSRESNSGGSNIGRAAPFDKQFIEFEGKC